MSWTLERDDGQRLDVNAWNWRPTLTLLERFDVLDPEILALLGYNTTVTLSGDEAERIAGFLDGYLPGVPAAGRVMLDGAVTTEPDTFELYRDDLAKNYSATVEWLTRLRDFCRTATDGFIVS